MDKDEEMGSSKKVSISDLKNDTLPKKPAKSISDHFAKLAKSNQSLFNSTAEIANLQSVSPINTLTNVFKKFDRNRTEVNYEQRLASINEEEIQVLIDNLRIIEQKLDNDDNFEYRFFQVNRDALSILLNHKRDFEQHTSELEQKLRYKQKEIDIEKRADWAAKFRLFFFRTLGAMLLVVTLFSIGFIEHNYEWARLPLSSYLKPDANKNTVGLFQSSFLQT